MRPLRSFAAVVIAFGLAMPGAALQAADDWQVVGHQGIVQIVVLPAERATDLPAYRAELARLCPPDRTCFVNFYTNTRGARLELPLPDAVANEATARFRRSTKNGVEVFQWSCRLNQTAGECF